MNKENLYLILKSQKGLGYISGIVQFSGKCKALGLIHRNARKERKQ
jgi:hypothetical protein